MLGKDVDLELVLKTTERQSRLSFECHGDLLIEGLCGPRIGAQDYRKAESSII